MLSEKIKEISKSISKELIDIRRELHKNPEIGSEINKTSTYIINILREIGLEVETGDKKGIVALLRGGKPGKTLLIRADIDALAMEEKNEVSYCSKIKGRMHACGHDAHTAFVIGAAIILKRLKENISGNIKFVFQPCEEGPNGVGAMDMINSGVLENPRVDAAIASHVFPEIESGKIGIKKGAVTSAPSGFKIIVKGKGGHASEPSKCVDPLLILNQIYMGIESVKKRVLQPDRPSVVTVTIMKSGEVHNIIPESAYLSGTIRTFDLEDSEKISNEIKNLSEAISKMHGAECTYKYSSFLVPTVNNSEIVDTMKESALKILDIHENIITAPIFMGADDFAFYTKRVPSCYFFVGVKNEEKGIVNPIHNDRFDIDESCIYKAAAVMAQFAIDYLKN